MFFGFGHITEQVGQCNGNHTSIRRRRRWVLLFLSPSAVRVELDETVPAISAVVSYLIIHPYNRQTDTEREQAL